MWEDDLSTMCPNQCTCQYNAFISSPLARWIDPKVSADHPFADPELNIKSIMCIIQNEVAFRDIVPAIPSDVHAITLLFTGASNRNVTNRKRIKHSKARNCKSIFPFSPHGRAGALP